MERLDDAEQAAKAALRIDALSHPARQLLDAIKEARLLLLNAQNPPTWFYIPPMQKSTMIAEKHS